MIAIRRATAADAAALACLHGAWFTEAWSEKSFVDLLASPGTFGLLAAENETLAGFIMARVAADEAEVLALVVCEASRRRGIALRLVSAAAQQASLAGATQFFLEVAAENPAARALYMRLGFREVGRRPAYYRDGSGEGLTMRAELPLTELGIGREVD